MKTRHKHDQHLRIYLDDHVALMIGELELARRCQRSNRSNPLGQFLHQLQVDLEQQRSILKEIVHRRGGREPMLKGRGAWLAEKIGRFKLNGAVLTYSKLSRVLELEMLAAAALARIALWDNLDAIAAADSRLAGIAFDAYREQSTDHLNEINTRRRYAAMQALTR